MLLCVDAFSSSCFEGWDDFGVVVRCTHIFRNKFTTNSADASFFCQTKYMFWWEMSGFDLLRWTHLSLQVPPYFSVTFLFPSTKSFIWHASLQSKEDFSFIFTEPLLIPKSFSFDHTAPFCFVLKESEKEALGGVKIHSVQVKEERNNEC